MSRNCRHCRPQRSGRRALALTFDELLLQPWFLTARVQRAVNALVPPSYRQKMRDFYDDYGCMICGGTLRYMANGMCFVCNGIVRRKLAASANRRLHKTLPRRVDLRLISKARLARKLLGEFGSEAVTGAKKGSSLASLQNPVDLVIGSHAR